MDMLPAELLLPSRRLEVLLGQALEHQQQRCTFLNTGRRPHSLLTDLRSDPEHLPSRTRAVLEDHTDEVWFLAFSPDGTQLATASLDRSVLLYSIGPLGQPTRRRALAHDLPVAHLAWSPDGRQLLTCCQNSHAARLWDAASGELVRCFEPTFGSGERAASAAKEAMTGPSACFHPSGRAIITGSHPDKR